MLLDHGPAILASVAMFQLVFLLFKSKGSEWGAHVVSLVHALIIVPLSVPILLDQTLSSDPFWGYSFYAGQVYSIAVGYFIWDTIYSIANIKVSGVGMVIHGISCLILYLGSFYPFLQYFGSIFLLFEASTVFLNLMWFAQATKSKYYSIFAVLFMITFFVVRIVFGLFQSSRFLGIFRLI